MRTQALATTLGSTGATAGKVRRRKRADAAVVDGGQSARDNVERVNAPQSCVGLGSYARAVRKETARAGIR